MFEGVILSWYGAYGGGTIGNMLNQWEQAGFFAYLLPFLLIFALVFGLLTSVKIFEDKKAINAIIAVVVGLMALQFGFVSQFFSEIFPMLGIGLAVLLVIIIFLGILMPKESWVNYTMFGVGAIIVIIIIAKTAGAVGWSSSWWWNNNWSTIMGIVFILAVIGIIVSSSKPKKPLGEQASTLVKNLFNQ
jgi:hypothetical protein